MTKTSKGILAYRPDIYNTPAIVDPYPHYRRLRELGPVVRLPRHRVYALAQRVERIELTEPPTWAVNNIIRRHDRLPTKLFGA